MLEATKCLARGRFWTYQVQGSVHEEGTRQVQRIAPSWLKLVPHETQPRCRRVVRRSCGRAVWWSAVLTIPTRVRSPSQPRKARQCAVRQPHDRQRDDRSAQESTCSAGRSSRPD